jgi:hypothetical protein
MFCHAAKITNREPFSGEGIADLKLEIFVLNFANHLTNNARPSLKSAATDFFAGKLRKQ